MTSPDEIATNFELLPDWEERYQYLIDLGNRLPALPESDRCARNRVDGCTSQVWMLGGFDGPDATLDLQLDGDAPLVRGLLALIQQLYAGLTRDEVLALDIHGLFERLGLLERLSPNRRSGLEAMVARIRALAAPGK